MLLSHSIFIMQMTQNQSGIEQINLGFNEQEDRLLLKLGLLDKTEIAVWVTRRVCKSMLNLLQSSNTQLATTSQRINRAPILSPESKNAAIQSFEREATEQKSIQDMDFKSEYIADRQTRTDEPMLATACVITSAENQPPHLELQCKNGQSVKMALNNELVHAMTNMMQLATREAGWDLSITVNDSPINLNVTHQVLH